MLGLDDLDSDGVRDLIIGATHYDSRRGYARVYSGRTLSLIRIHYGEFYDGKFGRASGQAGDLDGDGVSDYLVGAPDVDGGYAYAYSGQGGGLLWRVNGADGDRLGQSLTGLDDFDGDGTPDVLVGAPDADPRGVVDSGTATVHSGLDGALRLLLAGKGPADHFGAAVATLADLDLDGTRDFAVGAPDADAAARLDAGRLYCYSGAGAGPLFECLGPQAGDALGTSVAAAGDCNGDGLPDLILGAESAAPGGAIKAGSAFALSGSRLPLDAGQWTLAAGPADRVVFTLDGGPSRAGRPYVLLASMSGPWPGMDPGGTHVPLNFDAFTALALRLIGSGALQNAIGALDGAGRSWATLNSPGSLDPAFAGLQMWYAFVVLDPIDFASNAVPIEITP